jgi:hypothetical protein
MKPSNKLSVAKVTIVNFNDTNSQGKGQTTYVTSIVVSTHTALCTSTLH